MTKAKANRSNGKPTQQKRAVMSGPKRQVRRANRTSTLTVDEARYAALLHDPCTAPLTRPVYSTTGSGFLQRMESDFSIGKSGTSTAGSFVWVPGMFNSGAGGSTVTTSSINGAFYLGTTGTGAAPADDGTLCSWYNFYGANMPGNVFLATNAGVARCVAACMQVYWPGSELNRQGFVSVFRGSADDVRPFATDVSVANLRAASPYVCRIPQDKLEVKWQPDQADTRFVSTTPTVGANVSHIQSGPAAIGVTWAGLPADTGVRIRLVAVYEWQPRTNAASGIVMDGGSAVPTHGDLGNVIGYLQRNSAWFITKGMEVAAFLQQSAQYRTNRGRLTYRDEL